MRSFPFFSPRSSCSESHGSTQGFPTAPQFGPNVWEQLPIQEWESREEGGCAQHRAECLGQRRKRGPEDGEHRERPHCVPWQLCAAAQRAKGGEKRSFASFLRFKRTFSHFPQHFHVMAVMWGRAESWAGKQHVADPHRDLRGAKGVWGCAGQWHCMGAQFFSRALSLWAEKSLKWAFPEACMAAMLSSPIVRFGCARRGTRFLLEFLPTQ